MKRKLPILLAIALLAGAVTYRIFSDHPTPKPQPTNGRTLIHDGEEEGHSDERERWMESLHRAAPGTDWRQMEYQTRMEKHRRRAAQRLLRSDCSTVSLAEGMVDGKWAERGSSNQAGSVFDTEYDSATNDIWLISAGGSLWKGHLWDQEWEVVNQDLRFTPGLLRFISTQTGRRMIAFTSRLPHYSEDDGYSWQAAEGITHDDRWGDIHSPVMVDDSVSTIFVLAKPSYWEDIKLYRSVDKGEHYQPVSTFNTHSFDRLKLTTPHHYHRMLLVEKSSGNEGRIYKTDPSSGQLQWVNEGTNLNFGNARANLSGCYHNDSLLLYAYTSPQEGVWNVMRSQDNGLNWELRGSLPARPWEVGIYTSPSNPEHLFMGEVECYRSLDGGQSWEKINNWQDYYSDIEGSLHADMMHFSEFEMADGTPFLLISNHGGLSVSYDQLETTQNIGLSSLNVSQYYSVRTDPNSPAIVYAGSQDQGLQRSSEPGIAAFEQLISGDYGHLVFSNQGKHLWSVYPGGWVSYYDAPQLGNLTASYQLNSEEESVWLPPLMESPQPAENEIYMAGGNINGGMGSHLIRLAWQNGAISPSQNPFNFVEASAGGRLSAMDASQANPDYWYAATTNGRFFYSRDGGQSWEQSINFTPEGHYLYGQAVLASDINPERVLLAGSGYSNPPVFLSTDGGANFVDISEGLPPTLVYDLAANREESLYFAATEAGPYVYILPEGRWFDLAGNCAPVQTYWSVEYLDDQRIARFGTYGRGIWDFQLETSVDTDTPALKASQLKAWPNPSSGLLQLQLPPDGEWLVRLHAASGRTLQRHAQQSGSLQLDLSALPEGVYFLQAQSANGKRLTEKIVKR